MISYFGGFQVLKFKFITDGLRMTTKIRLATWPFFDNVSSKCWHCSVAVYLERLAVNVNDLVAGRLGRSFVC